MAMDGGEDRADRSTVLLSNVPGGVAAGELCCGLFSEFLHDVGYGAFDMSDATFGEVIGGRVPVLGEEGTVVTDSPGIDYVHVEYPEGEHEVHIVSPRYWADGIDPRVEAVARYLAGRPLENWAANMVAVADFYNIDHRLLPVISMLESGAGVAACGFNPFGLGSCGEAYRYGSWSEGIDAAAANLARPLYRDRPYAEQFAIWVSGSPSGGQDYVAKAMREMEKMR